MIYRGLALVLGSFLATTAHGDSVLNLLKSNEGSHLQSIFKRESGSDAPRPLPVLFAETFQIDKATADGGLELDEVMPVVRADLKVAYPCFRKPFGGSVAIQLKILDGEVAEASAYLAGIETTVALRFSECLAKRVTGWRFARHPLTTTVVLRFEVKRANIDELIQDIALEKKLAALDRPGSLGTIGNRCFGCPKAAVVPSSPRIGSPRGPPPPVAQVAFGTPLVTGPRAASDVATVLNYREQRRLRYCYDKELQNNRDLRGSLTLRLVVASSGAVTGATVAQSTPAAAALEDCVVSAAKRWQFPAANATATVLYPLTFDSADDPLTR